MDWTRPLAPLLVVLAAGCGPAHEAPFLASGGGGASEGEGLLGRAIEIGTLSEDGLQPWSDGELVEIVVGNQGFEMFTFHVEAPIEDGDPDGEQWCVRTHFVNDSDDPDDPLANAGDYCHGVDVEIVGGRMRLGPVLRVLTTKEVRGEALRFAVELSCASFTTVEVLDIELF